MEINSNQQPSSSTASGGFTNAQRPGEYLRQIRLSQKRELRDISRELNIPERHLIALEADDYKVLPEPAFIKGFLRSYAKFLGANADKLIQRFDEIYTSDTGLPTNHALDNSPLKALGRLQRGRKPRLGWLKWVVIALIALAMVWALVVGGRALFAGKSTQENSDTVSNSQLSAVKKDAPVVLALPATATSSEDKLSLTFSRPVDISVKDATGKSLASGRQSASITLQGESPFSIRLDDASAVSLSFNQEKISLTPYTVNGRAEFRLSR
ncbi:MAG: helix-turn-helix domain-containing protein [Moraxellaceae bacterium]|nr:MAG: helix-turn-helix domain-containing protein [Moraxellaceae bacterium]